MLISEAVHAYQPDPRVFRRALEELGREPHEVLHVGHSEVDNVLDEGGLRDPDLTGLRPPA